MEVIRYQDGRRSYTLFVTQGKQIELHTHHTDSNVYSVKVFWVGDLVEYDSFNFRYAAPIKGITAKNVILDLKDRCHKNDSKRMSLDEFAARNHNFDYEEMQRFNNQVGQCI